MARKMDFLLECNLADDQNSIHVSGHKGMSIPYLSS